MTTISYSRQATFWLPPHRVLPVRQRLIVVYGDGMAAWRIAVWLECLYACAFVSDI